MENFFDIPLPHDELAERAILGALMFHPEVVEYVINVLKPEDFFNESHRIVYEAILEIVERGETPHILTVKNLLEEKGKLDTVGGLIFLYKLLDEAATPSIVEIVVKQIKDKAVARGLIEISKKIIIKAKNSKDVNQLIEEAEAEIFRLNENRTISQYYSISEVIAETLKIINDLSKKDTIITGIPSGYYNLDRLTTGFHEGDLIIIAARPAMGKTSFALSIIHNTSVVEKYPSAFFSLEMSKEQIAMRLLSLESRIPLKKIRSGFLSEEELSRITEVAAEISNSPIYIDDTASLSILELKAKARRLKREKDIKLIIIDYLQLMRSNRRVESRQQEVAEISRGLKALAKELNIPVIALAQLSRQVEMRADKKPQLADLRESGCLTGDTLVINAETGELVPIKSMIGKQFYTLSMDKDLKIRKAFVSKVFYSGRKKVYLLKTRTGREIKASANHPFFKLDEKEGLGWYRLDNLKVGDRIAVPRIISTEIKTDVSDKELILLAHLLGDGCILPKQPYHYTSTDVENIKIVSKVAKELFDIKTKIVKQKNWYHVYFTSPYKLGKNKKHPITLWFEKLGIDRVHSYKKEIPKFVFSLSLEKLALFIKHLWATDGSIHYSKSSKKERITIYYSSTSKYLIHQLQHLLLKFGIISFIKETKKKGYRPNYNLYIYGKENQKKFLEKIGCFGSRGKNIPKILEVLDKKIENTNIDTIPKEVWEFYIKKLKHLHNITWRNFAKKLNMAYCGSSIFKNSISRKRLLKIANIFNDIQLYNLANSDILWDEIVSIEELGVEDVYDMTVEETHNFIANDIVVHNSIEQDADLVMFIHRPEYYKKNPTPEEEGIAEIIIAKQRNGPTDIVKLAFIKEITKFENLAEGKEEEILKEDDIIEENSPINELEEDTDNIESEIIFNDNMFEDDEIDI